MLSENQHASGALVSEANGTRSRDQVTILAGSGAERVLTANMVLGKVTASGKYVQFDQDAVDGTENAAGVLRDDVTAPDGTDAVAVAYLRDCEVNGGELTWPSDIDPGEQTAAEAQLVALGILVR